MKHKGIVYISICVIVVLLLSSGLYYNLKTSTEQEQVDVFIGVDAAYDNMQIIKNLVDEVKNYTNFFVIGSTGITLNTTRLNEVCQYLNDSDLHFAPFTHTTTDFNQSQWITEASQRWSSYFSGLYVYDEPAGHQLDGDVPYMIVEEASNYTDAANKYVANLNEILAEYQPHNLPIITSDYALYEYVYRGGYDIVLAQYAWNHSRALSTALCRGAATMNNKEWGVMITYTYDEEPYLASGSEIYQDMITAYQNGAKYILLFDYVKNKTSDIAHSILKQEHFDALKKFWYYIRENPRSNSEIPDRIAYVLPKDYGYGFRGPDDWIWGLFSADNLSGKIWHEANIWVEKNKPGIDIIYEDTLRCNTPKYRKLVFWNGTIITNQALLCP